MMNVLWSFGIVAGATLIYFGAETFADHLAAASKRLRVSAFALALLLAGAEPEELATAIIAAAREAPAVAYGDVVGANVVTVLLALGIGALVQPLAFSKAAKIYAAVGLGLAAVGAFVIWDSTVTRPEAGFLVAAYFAFVLAVWISFREPPQIGETYEMTKSVDIDGSARRDVGLLLIGFAGLVGGSTLLVESVINLTGAEDTQLTLGLTVIGFATAVEMIILVVAMARRNMADVVLASVIGSVVYNVSLTLGAAALVEPLELLDANKLRISWMWMTVAIAVVLLAAVIVGRISKKLGWLMIGSYGAFVLFSIFA